MKTRHRGTYYNVIYRKKTTKLTDNDDNNDSNEQS